MSIEGSVAHGAGAPNTAEEMVTILFRTIGMPAHIKGYRFCAAPF